MSNFDMGLGPHGEIAFSNSTCFYNALFCFTTYAKQKKIIKDISRKAFFTMVTLLMSLLGNELLHIRLDNLQ